MPQSSLFTQTELDFSNFNENTKTVADSKKTEQVKPEASQKKGEIYMNIDNWSEDEFFGCDVEIGKYIFSFEEGRSGYNYGCDNSGHVGLYQIREKDTYKLIYEDCDPSEEFASDDRGTDLIEDYNLTGITANDYAMAVKAAQKVLDKYKKTHRVKD